MLKLEEYFLPTMTLRGRRVVATAAEMANVAEDAPAASLWRAVLALTSLNPRTSVRYGLLRALPDGKVEYLACVRASDVASEDMELVTVEGGYFIGAEHVGDVATLSESVRWFYEEYLPTSGYVRRNEWHVEIFDPRFDPADPESILTFGVFVERPNSPA